MEQEKNIGPTGEFPDGKLDDADKGAIRIGIGVDKKKRLVVLEFGIPIRWIGLSQMEAISMAEIILAKSELLNERGEEGKPSVVG